MVFSSVPVYLDPPNWHQQSNHHQQQGSGSSTEILHQLPPLPPNPHAAAGAGGLPAAGSIRPGSMSDRARLAKIPQPESALKCPRCESTNTKFCYFNNYSLSQPRHFCKTCRRYWTRGGALRSVPVGGGCRRNKKSKSSSNSKSPVNNNSTERSQSSNNNSTSIINAVVPSEIIGHPQLSFMASLQNLTNQFGLNLSGFQAAEIGGSNTLTDLGFQGGTNSGLSINTHHDMLSAGAGGGRGVQQFPFFEPLTGLYPFQSNEGINDHQGQASSSMVGERSMTAPGSARVSQMGPPAAKMEDSQFPNLSRPQFSGVSSSENNNNQYWGGNTWTDLSGLNSSSSNHHLL